MYETFLVPDHQKRFDSDHADQCHITPGPSEEPQARIIHMYMVCIHLALNSHS